MIRWMKNQTFTIAVVTIRESNKMKDLEQTIIIKSHKLLVVCTSNLSIWEVKISTIDPLVKWEVKKTNRSSINHLRI